MDEPRLQVGIEETTFGASVTVAGEVDLLTSTQLTRSFDLLLERQPAPATIRADLRNVDFMDSTGIAVLLGARTRALKVGSRLVVTAASPVLQRLFDVTGIGELLAHQQSQG